MCELARCPDGACEQIVGVTIVSAAARRFVLIFRMSMNEQTEAMLAPPNI